MDIQDIRKEERERMFKSARGYVGKNIEIIEKERRIDRIIDNCFFMAGIVVGIWLMKFLFS